MSSPEPGPNQAESALSKTTLDRALSTDELPQCKKTVIRALRWYHIFCCFSHAAPPNPMIAGKVKSTDSLAALLKASAITEILNAPPPKAPGLLG